VPGLNRWKRTPRDTHVGIMASRQIKTNRSGSHETRATHALVHESTSGRALPETRILMQRFSASWASPAIAGHFRNLSPVVRAANDLDTLINDFADEFTTAHLEFPEPGGQRGLYVELPPTPQFTLEFPGEDDGEVSVTILTTGGAVRCGVPTVRSPWCEARQIQFR
jgi:hypothetical protein